MTALAPLTSGEPTALVDGLAGLPYGAGRPSTGAPARCRRRAWRWTRARTTSWWTA
ncbi:hypothetical protein ACH41H_19500 [Streptomyces sp. NPDC020800]|uniref:hypothetical protein n=1 Tax=Streptomyces sp. NPDC020800 TaxID=3365092 RepID=UPI0037B15DCF